MYECIGYEDQFAHGEWQGWGWKASQGEMAWCRVFERFSNVSELLPVSLTKQRAAERNGVAPWRTQKKSTVSKKTNTNRVQSIPPVTLKGLHKKLWKFLFSTCLPTHIQIHHTYQYISHYVFSLLPIHFQCFFYRCFWAFKGVFSEFGVSPCRAFSEGISSDIFQLDASLFPLGWISDLPRTIL